MSDGMRRMGIVLPLRRAGEAQMNWGGSVVWDGERFAIMGCEEKLVCVRWKRVRGVGFDNMYFDILLPQRISAYHWVSGIVKGCYGLCVRLSIFRYGHLSRLSILPLIERLISKDLTF